MAGQRRARHAIIALRQHTRSDDVGRGVLSLPLDCIHGQTLFGVEMLSSPLGSTHGRTTSSVKSNHCLLDNHMVGRRRCGMLASPVDCKHGQMMSGVACRHRHWAAHAVARDRA
ncbi:hypothetical protein EJD97_021229 [Solanum chilense]|uniref:Uncharacterized protein n=1 Tax=Solanum chilense TaxID=4083 RepID=A0A6N2ADD6_SOLCI|nr:hypothetical protein EJD97_021229 [Solanum chilense]